MKYILFPAIFAIYLLIGLLIVKAKRKNKKSSG